MPAIDLNLLSNWLPVLIFAIVAIAISVLLLGLGWLLSPSNPEKEKLSAYECGFAAFEVGQQRFDIRFYLVTLLFIIFDLEIAFLFPWAIGLDTLGKDGFIVVMLFLTILTIGFIYEWKKGALQWE